MVSISQGEVKDFRHNLGTTELLVYMMERMMEGAPQNVKYYGTTDSDQGAFLRIIPAWPNKIQVYRGTSDGEWAQVRVMIWKIQEPPT